MRTKTCKKCDEEKQLDDFYDKQSTCIKCYNIRQLAYNKNHADEILKNKIKRESELKRLFRKYQLFYLKHNKNVND